MALTHVALQQDGSGLSADIERMPICKEPISGPSSADAMELTVEGERLITQAIVQMARDLWDRLRRALAAMLSVENRHLPPI